MSSIHFLGCKLRLERKLWWFSSLFPNFQNLLDEQLKLHYKVSLISLTLINNLSCLVIYFLTRNLGEIVIVPNIDWICIVYGGGGGKSFFKTNLSSKHQPRHKKQPPKSLASESLIHCTNLSCTYSNSNSNHIFDTRSQSSLHNYLLFHQTIRMFFEYTTSSHWDLYLRVKNSKKVENSEMSHIHSFL